MASPSRTVYAILGFLTVRPMSGYDIKKAVEVSIANFWKESYGQIYPMLRRLAEDGLVEKTQSDSGGNRPRHVYAITDKGREELGAWLRVPADPPPLRMELLLKLFFGSQVDHTCNRRQIEVFRQRTLEELEHYRAIRAVLTAQHSAHPDLPYWLMTLRFGERDHEAHLEWCDEALELLDQGVATQTDERATVVATLPVMASARDK